MIEPEIAFADLNDDANLAEDFLKQIFRDLLNERPDDMDFFAKRIDKTCIDRLRNFIESPFERMTYTDAIARLEKAAEGGKKFEFPVSWGMDLQSEHERYLTEELVGRPVVVTDYPKDIKAFYMRMNDDGRTVAAMDVLAPGIAKSSVVHNAKSDLMYSTRGWPKSGSSRSRTGGIAICGSTARFRTRASDSGLNARSSMRREWQTFATLFRSRGRRETRTSERVADRVPERVSSSLKVRKLIPACASRAEQNDSAARRGGSFDRAINRSRDSLRVHSLIVSRAFGACARGNAFAGLSDAIETAEFGRTPRDAVEIRSLVESTGNQVETRGIVKRVDRKQCRVRRR